MDSREVPLAQLPPTSFRQLSRYSFVSCYVHHGSQAINTVNFQSEIDSFESSRRHSNSSFDSSQLGATPLSKSNVCCRLIK